MTLDLPYPWITDPEVQGNFERIRTEWRKVTAGSVVLVAGTATVLHADVQAGSLIFLTAQVLGTVAAPKALAVTARSAGVSFTITSSDATDTSTVAWQILDSGSST